MSEEQYSTDTANDLAVANMLRGASFGPDAGLTLPSGLTLDSSAANTLVNPDRTTGTRYLRVPDEAHHLFALRPGGVVEHFDLCHQVWHPAPVEVLEAIVATFGAMTEVAHSDLPAVAQ